jgi:HEAT repeat protein
MNKIFKSLLVVFAMLLVTTTLQAQENRTLTTKIADLLAQMPSNNLQQRDKLAEELIALGDEGFQKLAEKMTPSGKGDNSAVVFAINGLTRYVSQPGKEDKRALTEKWLINALDQTADTETKSFYMRQLKLIGTDKAANSVSKYLLTVDLCEPATFVLTSVKGETSKNELTKAFQKADGNTLITITRALGELQVKEANTQILKNITSENQNLKKVALAAVAAIGAPESYEPLLSAARKAGFVYEPSNATSAFLSYAQRLGETGDLQLCARACDDLINQCQSPAQLHTKAAALAVNCKYFEKEGQSKLLKAFDNGDKPFRIALLNLAASSNLASGKDWISKAKKAQPEVKGEIITMLGNKGDLSAAEFIQKQFGDGSPSVSQAAISAYAKLKGKGAIPEITALLKKGVQAEFAAKTLMSLVDEKGLDQIAAILASAPENSKNQIIAIIGSKSGKRFFDQIYPYTGSSVPSISSAAYAAMKNTAAPKDIDQLVKLLFATDDKDKIKDIQDALVNASLEIKGEAEQVNPLLSQLGNAPNKGRILEVLPRLGGKQALKAVNGFISSTNQEESNAAVNALINWKDQMASASLYEICKTSSGERQSNVIKGFLRQIKGSAIPEDQKLLQYRKIIPYAADNKDKSLIIKSIGQLKTFLALTTAAAFLENSALAADAAQSVMAIALPSDGQKGLTGSVVRSALNKSINSLAGSESDYDKAKIRNYLAEMSYEDGLVPMFNGKDLTGWQGLVGNPISRRKMDPKELEKKQAEANLKVASNWSAKDGCIIFNGSGDNLCSIKQYGDFEMVVDWRITKKGDSGLYLRGTPQVQIWDTSRVEVGAQVGSGGLYNNQKNPKNPLKVADNPVGEWNTFRIKMVGELVTVYLNGELVVDNVKLENYWDRSLPIFPKESIELQAHGTDLAFRDIYVQELNNNEYTVPENEAKEGFVPLFNGKNLDGWVGNKVDYQVENGEMVLHIDKGPSHGNIFTADEYSDFIYRFEFQLSPAGNNGLGIRAPLTGDAAYEGMEIQILDNEDPVYAALAPYQYHGSVYGIIPAKRGYLKPVGEWNYEEVIAKGTHIKVTLNGTVILDGDIKEAAKNGPADHKAHPGLLRQKGHIGYLGHGSVVKFKNIRLKDLSKK